MEKSWVGIGFVDFWGSKCTLSQDLEGPALQWCNFLQIHDIHMHMAMFSQSKLEIHGLEKTAWAHVPWGCPKDTSFLWSTKMQAWNQMISIDFMVSQAYGYVFAIQILDYILWSLDPGIDSCSLLIVHDPCFLPQIMHQNENRMISCSDNEFSRKRHGMTVGSLDLM